MADVRVSVFIEDHQQLQTAKTISKLLPESTLLRDVLDLVGKKAFLTPEETKQYQLFLSRYGQEAKESRAAEPLDLASTVGSLVLAEKDQLVFRKLKRNELSLTVVVQGHQKLQMPKTLSPTIETKATVGEVIALIASKAAAPVHEESCALFLPTNKSKTGIFMERDRTIKSFHLEKKARVIFKHRDADDIVLVIQIDNYKELECARSVTSIFNRNHTVGEIIAKIARKGNVFIEDKSQYELCDAKRKKFKPHHSLSHYGVQNRDTLILRPKERFRSGTLRFRRPSRANAIILCERDQDETGQVFRFESKDHERLYFNMSITDFKRTSNKDLLASAAAELSPPSSPPTPHFMATNSDTSVAGSSSSSYSSSSFSLSSSSEASAPESPTISDSSRRVRISAPVVIPEKKPSSTTLVSPPTSPTRTTSKPALLTPSSPAHAPPLGASATASTGSSARQLGGETAAAGPRKQPSALLLNVTPPRQPSSREVESPARTPSALRILGQRTTSALRVQDTQRTTSTTKISLLMPRTVSKGQVGGPARTTSKASLAQEAPATPPTQPLRKPGQLAKRPGALPRKNKTFVDPDALILVQIYILPNRFWTLAVNHACTVRDVLKSIATRVDDVSSAELCTAIKADLTVLEPLDHDDNINELKEKLPTTQCFFLRQSMPMERERKMTRENLMAASETLPPRTSDDTLAFSTREKARLSNLVDPRQDISGRRLTVVGTTPKPRRTNSLPNLAIFVGTPASFEWIDPKDIVKEKKISKGAFAKVYKGKYKEHPVAIKTLKGELTEQQIHSFTSEFEIMSNVRSPRLVTFYGACVEADSKLSMVMEFCSGGSLFDVMNDLSFPIDWKRALQWYTEIVQGVEFLHNFDPPLVHRDIKSLNLLLDEQYHIKVCDFGLSRFRTMTNLGTLGEIRGTMAYCPPEIYDGAIFSSKSDVYSLGVVLWELCIRTVTGEYKRPFSEFNDINFDFQIIVMTNRNQLRPSIPPEVPQVWRDLIELCWHQDPDKRPTCTGVLVRLAALQTEFERNPDYFSLSVPSHAKANTEGASTPAPANTS